MHSAPWLPHPTLFEFGAPEPGARIDPDGVSLLHLPESEDGWRGRLVGVFSVPVGTLRYRPSLRCRTIDEPLAAASSEFQLHGELEASRALEHVFWALDTTGFPLRQPPPEDPEVSNDTAPMDVFRLVSFWVNHGARVVQHAHEISERLRDRELPSWIHCTPADYEVVADRVLGAWIGSPLAARHLRQIAAWGSPVSLDSRSIGLSEPNALEQPIDGLTPLLLLARVDRPQLAALSRFGVNSDLAARLRKLPAKVTLRLMRYARFPNRSRCSHFFGRLLPLMVSWWRSDPAGDEFAWKRFHVATALMARAASLRYCAPDDDDRLGISDVLEWLDWITCDCWHVEPDRNPDYDPDYDPACEQYYDCIYDLKQLSANTAPIELSIPASLLVAAVERAALAVASSPGDSSALRISRKWLHKRDEWRNHRLYLQREAELGEIIDLLPLSEVLSPDFAVTPENPALQWHCRILSAPDAWQAFVAERSLIDSGLEVTPLNTVYALSKEGEAMCHCCWGMSPDAMVGRLRLFSMRRAGERVATLSIRKDAFAGPWRLAECRGRTNCDVGLGMESGGRLTEMVDAVLAFYNLPTRGTPQAPAMRFETGYLNEASMTRLT